MQGVAQQGKSLRPRRRIAAAGPVLLKFIPAPIAPSQATEFMAPLGGEEVGVGLVAPLATGSLNVNADEMAAALAVGLGAARICFLIDVPGLLLAGAVVPEIGADHAERLFAAGTLEGGILPKLRAAVTAAVLGGRAENGASAVTACQVTL